MHFAFTFFSWASGNMSTCEQAISRPPGVAYRMPRLSANSQRTVVNFQMES